MIIGGDLMEFLGIDVRFSTRTIEWENHSMPFKTAKATMDEDYHIEESMTLSEKFDIMAADNASKVERHLGCQMHCSRSRRDCTGTRSSCPTQKGKNSLLCH